MENSAERLRRPPLCLRPVALRIAAALTSVVLAKIAGEEGALAVEIMRLVLDVVR